MEVRRLIIKNNSLLLVDNTYDAKTRRESNDEHWTETPPSQQQSIQDPNIFKISSEINSVDTL